MRLKCLVKDMILRKLGGKREGSASDQLDVLLVKVSKHIIELLKR